MNVHTPMNVSSSSAYHTPFSVGMMQDSLFQVRSQVLHLGKGRIAPIAPKIAPERYPEGVHSSRLQCSNVAQQQQPLLQTQLRLSVRGQASNMSRFQRLTQTSQHVPRTAIHTCACRTPVSLPCLASSSRVKRLCCGYPVCSVPCTQVSCLACLTITSLHRGSAETTKYTPR